MTAHQAYSDRDETDAGPTLEAWREAWHQAREQADRECWIGIHQKCSDTLGAWRDCSLGICRRAHRCSDERLVCREDRRRKAPSPEMTPEEHARVAHDLKQALQREIAKRKARGETSDRADRIARLAAQKLGLPRAVSSADQ